jgi:hypothetical protein
MRQWLVNPKMLCDKHLLGEHVEAHMFIGALIKKRSIAGFISKGLYDSSKVYSRHDELVIEMTNRGINHKSPLLSIEIPVVESKVNIENNIQDLKNRCVECRKRIQELGY